MPSRRLASDSTESESESESDLELGQRRSRRHLRRPRDRDASDTESESSGSESGGSSSSEDEGLMRGGKREERRKGCSVVFLLAVVLLVLAIALVVFVVVRNQTASTTLGVGGGGGVAQTQATGGSSTSTQVAAIPTLPSSKPSSFISIQASGSPPSPTSASGSHHGTSKVATSTSSASTSILTSSPTTTTGNTTGSCFPLGSAQLPASGVPSVDRASWWCPDAELYGFLGFSYPMEVDDCSDSTNGFEAINRDFKNMKRQFGATFVRIYAPQCRDVSVWENLVKACVENNIALIPMVWWGFGDQSLWKKTQSSIYALFQSSTYKGIAPFVVHSASFGSEPIGDGVNGSTSQFVKDLASFRAQMQTFGVPVGISEDWDRPGVMSANGGGSGLGSTGSQIKANTDIVHAHIMPYYHPTEAKTATDAWTYVQAQLKWLTTNVAQSIMVTETMWASAKGGHSRGGSDDQISLSSYTTYWDAFSSGCDTFKEYKAGWFVHTYSDAQEPGFGMLDTSGKSKIANFKPTRC